MQNDISVVLTGNCPPEVLKKVLWGYNTQTYRNFELVIVGDAKVPDEVKAELFFPVITVGNHNNGTVIDQAMPACGTGYLLVADGHAIPRHDFVEQHIKYREEGYYLTGALTDIATTQFDNITREDIYSGKCFSRPGNGNKSGLIGSIMNRIVPPDAEWNNINASGWKDDLCGNGPRSKELKPRQIKYSTVGLRPKNR
jgi:hypothetical protein